MEQIKLTTEFITLTQLLKDQNLIQTGGQAKWFLADEDNIVMVNSEIERRRGRKLYRGDKIVVNDTNKFEIV